ncbi:MAG: hypothetical protein IPP52_09170 [Ignavibacteria bacterium]|nr:hypothetical protein [Ignavibacteria bacterium]
MTGSTIRLQGTNAKVKGIIIRGLFRMTGSTIRLPGTNAKTERYYK